MFQKFKKKNHIKRCFGDNESEQLFSTLPKARILTKVKVYDK